MSVRSRLRCVARATSLRAVSAPPLPPSVPATPPLVRIRRATSGDLDEIVELENAVFDLDRVSERQWRHHLDSLSAEVFVAIRQRHVVGAALVLHRRGSTISRLYSVAVAASERGHRVGERLLMAVERAARRRGSSALRLEVRAHNLPAQRLYERAGWHRFGHRHAYYEDGEDALRYEKSLS